MSDRDERDAWVFFYGNAASGLLARGSSFSMAYTDGALCADKMMLEMQKRYPSPGGRSRDAGTYFVFNGTHYLGADGNLHANRKLAAPFRGPKPALAAAEAAGIAPGVVELIHEDEE